MSEPTTLHARIIDIIESEWLRPFNPDDCAGDTPGARAYDAARYVNEAIQDELDRRASKSCKLRDARIAELTEERDGLIAVLSEVNRILDRWVRPDTTAHASNCVHAVHELRALLEPGHTPEEP